MGKIILKEGLEERMLKDYEREVGMQKALVSGRGVKEVDRARARGRIAEIMDSIRALQIVMKLPGKDVISGGYKKEELEQFEGMIKDGYNPRTEKRIRTP